VSLYSDLLDQAGRLATQEPRRPRQASLRRSVSASYYALCHLLIDAATKRVVGGRNDLAAPRRVLARGYDHRGMVDASKAFASGTLPVAITAAWPTAAIPRDLQVVASAFVQLQQARHDADYNLAKAWSRSDALAQYRRASQAFAAWGRVRRDAMAVLYLGLLGNHGALRRR